MPERNPAISGILRGLQLATTLKLTQQREEEGQRRERRDQELTEFRKSQSAAQKENRDFQQQRMKLLDRLSILNLGGESLSPQVKAMTEALDDPATNELLGSAGILGDFSGAATSARGRTVEHEGQQFLIPSQQERQSRDLQGRLSEAEAMADVGDVALPAGISQQLGIPEGTMVRPESIPAFQRAIQPPAEESPREGQLVIDDQGQISLIDRVTGEARSVKGGRGKRTRETNQPGRLTTKQKKDQLIQEAASRFLVQAETVDDAIKKVRQAASEDEFTSKNAVAIIKSLRQLKDRAPLILLPSGRTVER